MDPVLNPFKQALKSGRLQIGFWHSLSSHLVVEILADFRVRLEFSSTPSTPRTKFRWCSRSFRR